MEIAYAAYTESCVFMLDDDGICRWVVTRGAKASPTTSQNAQRCIGAQYVASLDLGADGGLVATPQVGSPMLFAFVDKDGRIALVRSGSIVKFEDRRASLRPLESTPTLRYELDALTLTAAAPSRIDAIGANGGGAAIESGEYDLADGSGSIDVSLADASIDLLLDGSRAGGDDEDSTLPYDVNHMRRPTRLNRISGVRARSDGESRDTIPSPFAAPRLSMEAMEPADSDVAPASSGVPSRDEMERCVTGRYLPIQERALQHLARLKK